MSLEIAQKLKIQDFKKNITELQTAKMFIVNGRINKAKRILDNLNDLPTKLENIKKRYVSLIYFIKGDYKNSLEILNSMNIQEQSVSFKDICLIKIFSHMALDKITNLEQLLLNCKISSNEYAKSFHFWPSNMASLKMLKQSSTDSQSLPIESSITSTMLDFITDVDTIQLWLKIAIYSNMEAKLVPLLKHISPKIYQSATVRELIGLLYYRLNDFDNSLKYLSEINTANAENIIGNILLKTKQYEIAFGHFNLALRYKHNSLNSLERNIPLSWLLGKWDNGINFINLLTENGIEENNITTLKTAFLIQQNQYEKAWNQIQMLKTNFKKALPLKILLMGEYLSLILNKADSINYFSDNACKKFNGLSCWIKHQSIQWKSLPALIQNDTTILDNDTISLDLLKESADVSPIIEELVIGQRDIEELDSIEFGITPRD